MLFLIALSSEVAAAKLVAKVHVSLCGKKVNVEQAGPQLHHVSVFRLSRYVQDEALVQVLSAYVKPTNIDYVILRGRPDIKTSTRIVCMTTNKPVSNLIVIYGNRVMVQCRGIRRASL